MYRGDSWQLLAESEARRIEKINSLRNLFAFIVIQKFAGEGRIYL